MPSSPENRRPPFAGRTGGKVSRGGDRPYPRRISSPRPPSVRLAQGRRRPPSARTIHGTTLMKTIKGPAIFLAQFAGDSVPFNSLDAIAGWAAVHGYKGVQIPSWDARLFDLRKAAESRTYCDELTGRSEEHTSELHS